MTPHAQPPIHAPKRAPVALAVGFIVGIPTLTFALVFGGVPPWSTLYTWIDAGRPTLLDAGLLVLPTMLLVLALVLAASAVGHIARLKGARLRQRWHDRQR